MRAGGRRDPGGDGSCARMVQAGSDLASEHAPLAPPAHVAKEVPNSVEILDRVGAAQGAVARAGDAEPPQRERLVQAFA